MEFDVGAFQFYMKMLICITGDSYLSYLYWNGRSTLDAIRSVQTQEIKTVSTAAKAYGVPRSTLQLKLSGKSPLERKIGPETYLTREEEWILAE